MRDWDIETGEVSLSVNFIDVRSAWWGVSVDMDLGIRALRVDMSSRKGLSLRLLLRPPYHLLEVDRLMIVATRSAL